MASLYAEHAREILGVGPEWQVSSWKCLDGLKNTPGAPGNRIRITGSIAPALPDGRVAWEYEEKGTRKSVTFTNAEHDAWILEWETKTENCSQCSTLHPGQEWMGWDHITGTKYRPCPRCNGTGKLIQEPARATA
jgi:hypothetical protein